MEYLNHIKIDTEKCIGCGLCKKACPAMLMDLADGKAICKPFDKLSWYGCWKCQHCMAVCPTAAISVMDRLPENSLPMPDASMSVGDTMDALVAGRRSCRHYKQENVDPALVNQILKTLENTPTGGNKMLVEYTIIDDMESMKKLRKIVDDGYTKLWKQGIFPRTWDDESMSIMRSREDQAMNGDMYFCSAPHYFIPHMPAKFHSAPTDTALTAAYFELLCAAHGLGAVYLGFPRNIMQMMPEVYKLLQIPEDHFVGATIGFGYPVFDYARGVQKDGNVKIHRITI